MAKLNRFPRHLLAVLGAAALFIAAVPAVNAQSSSELHGRMAQLEERIARSADRGRISPREARQLRSELQRIREQEDRMRSDGRLDGRERQVLDRRLDRLGSQLSDARKN